MSIDEKAYQKAYEMTNDPYTTIPLHIRLFVEAYEAAKSEQPVELSLMDDLIKTMRECSRVIDGFPALLLGDVIGIIWQHFGRDNNGNPKPGTPKRESGIGDD